MVQLYSGTTVTFVNSTVTGTDSYGNDVYSPNNVDVDGCAVNYVGTTESWQGTEQIEADVTVYAPLGTTVDTPFDAMIINGLTYNVVGVPRSWNSPFSGTQGVDEILGKLFTTGGAAE
jgi:hypothetical protein